MGQLSSLISHFVVFTYKSPARSDDNGIKQKQDRGKREYYRHHTDQRASGHQHAQGGDDGNSRIHSYPEGRREEGHRADEDTLDRRLVGDQNCLALALSGSSLHLITARHQNRVVDGRAQLDRSDDDRGDERKRRSCVIGEAHVDEDCALDDQDQKDRQAQ